MNIVCINSRGELEVWTMTGHGWLVELHDDVGFLGYVTFNRHPSYCRREVLGEL